MQEHRGNCRKVAWGEQPNNLRESGQMHPVYMSANGKDNSKHLWESINSFYCD